MRQGARTDLEPNANLPEVSTSAAAELLNVSERSVIRARKVKENGTTELLEAVKGGEIAVSDAAGIVNEDEDTHARGSECFLSHRHPHTWQAVTTLHA